MKSIQEAPAGMRGVRVRVTALDIKKGCVGNSYACPIARAVNRHLKPEFRCSVGTSDVVVYSNGPERFPEPALPTVAREFVGNFDTFPALELKPFSFNLPIPEVALRRAKAVRS